MHFHSFIYFITWTTITTGCRLWFSKLFYVFLIIFAVHEILLFIHYLLIRNISVMRMSMNQRRNSRAVWSGPELCGMESPKGNPQPVHLVARPTPTPSIKGLQRTRVHRARTGACRRTCSSACRLYAARCKEVHGCHYVTMPSPVRLSWSNVSACGTFVQNILQPLLLGSYFKVSTILPLLILLKKPTSCNVCYFNFILAL